MKYKFIIFCILSLILNLRVISQNISISETDSLPHPSAILDIFSENKGVLIPRVKLNSISDTISISSPEISLLVYNDTVNEDIDEGFYYWNGETWNKFILNNDPWLLEGNSGTSPSTNFLGTTDNVDLVFRTNNTEYVRIKSDGDVGIGTSSPQKQLSITKSFSHPHTSSSSIGVIYKDSVWFIHNYKDSRAIGKNAFFGGHSGNFTMTSSSDYNTGLGDSTLTSLTSGRGNTASGYTSLVNNTTGQNNTANGLRSLYNNTTGSNNVAIGSYSLFKNTNRSGLVAVGDSSLFNNGQNVTQTYHATRNTAVGDQSLYANTTGFYNTATGYMSGIANSTGYYNSNLGYLSILSNTTGYWLVSVGANALRTNSTAIRSTAFGKNSLYDSNAHYSSGYGVSSLENATSGGNNTATGAYTIKNLTTGIYNCAIGYNALRHNTTYSYNTAIGHNTYYNKSSSQYSNSTALGYNVVITSSNTVRFGNSSVSSIGGKVTWASFSDGRFKTNVQEDVVGTDFIMLLRPVTFKYNTQGIVEFLQEDYLINENDELIYITPSHEIIESRNNKSSIVYSGFIAQEVEASAKIAGYDFSAVKAPNTENELYMLELEIFVVPLVKAAQERQDQIEDLFSILEEITLKIEELENKQ